MRISFARWLLLLTVGSTMPAAAAPPAAQPPTAQETIRREGKLIVSDGSSYYLIEKGGRFESGPLGISGRTISGTWKTDGALFIIEGTWSWLNGLSKPNDRRRMKLAISNLAASGAPVRQPLSPVLAGKGPIKTYSCYFIIDELVRLDARP